NKRRCTSGSASILMKLPSPSSRYRLAPHMTMTTGAAIVGVLCIVPLNTSRSGRITVPSPPETAANRTPGTTGWAASVNETVRIAVTLSAARRSSSAAAIGGVAGVLARSEQATSPSTVINVVTIAAWRARRVMHDVDTDFPPEVGKEQILDTM